MSMNMEVFYAKKQAEASGHKPAKKVSRKPKLTGHQKGENKKKSCKNYRLKKAVKNSLLFLMLLDEYERSEAENRSLKEKMEVLQSKMEVQQSEINSLNKELSEARDQSSLSLSLFPVFLLSNFCLMLCKLKTKARANKLETDLSDQSKIMNVVKMANEALKLGMQQLHQDFLDQDVQASKV
ncbi:hypothetical protein SCA6_013910 [Theobroma cacao]